MRVNDRALSENGRHLRRSAGIKSPCKSLDIFWLELVRGIFDANAMDI
jgi:hypothetical protein